MTDSEYLTSRLPHATDGQLHDFTERVGIKEDSGISIYIAQDQSFIEIIK